MRVTESAPNIPPKKDIQAIGIALRHSISPFLAKLMVAESVAEAACNLLVAIADTGGTPDKSNAGRVIKPPPPAIASINPATIATKPKISRSSKFNSLAFNNKRIFLQYNIVKIFSITK
ncbi:hypothetical protein D9M71_382640 [compost metagenome]